MSSYYTAVFTALGANELCTMDSVTLLSKRDSWKGRGKMAWLKEILDFIFCAAIHEQFTQAVLCFMDSTWEVFSLPISLYYK